MLVTTIMLITINSITIGIRTGLSTSLFSLLVSIINTVTTLMIFVYYILAVILKIVFLGLPHVFKLIFIVVEFHRTQLGIIIILLPLLTLTSLILILKVSMIFLLKQW